MSYFYPDSVEQAVAELERGHGRARIISGGTDLMPGLSQGRCSPEHWVDITRIPGLRSITPSEGWIEVGAAVSFADIIRSPLLRDRVHALMQAAESVGAAPIQAAATWVGNIVQAMPAADGAIVALALEAEARIVNAAGARWVGVESLFAGPGRSTVDPTHELITHIRFRVPGAGWGSAWRRIGRRPSLVLPILNCAVAVQLDEGRRTFQSATIAIGPVAQVPFRAKQAEQVLVGCDTTPEVIAQAARIAQLQAHPRSNRLRASGEYRLEVLPILLRDTLTLAVSRARD